MEKISKGITIMVTILVILIFFALSSGTSAAANKYTFKAPTFLPAHNVHCKLFYQWLDKIEKESNGQISFKRFPSQQLCTQPQEFDYLSKGLAQMGMPLSMVLPRYSPALGWMSIPGLVTYANFDDLLGNLREAHEAEFAKYKIKYLAPIVGDMIDNVCHRSKFIKKMEDAEGMKLCMAGGLMVKVAEAAKINMISMNTGERYTAMQRGVLDGVWSGPSGIVPWKWYEPGKYNTVYLPSCNAGYYLVMNMSSWKSLPGNLQKVVQETANEMTVVSLRKIPEARNNLIGKIEEKAKLHKMSKTEHDRWVEAIGDSVYVEYEKQAGDSGKPFLDVIKKWKK